MPTLFSRKPFLEASTSSSDILITTKDSGLPPRQKQIFYMSQQSTIQTEQHINNSRTAIMNGSVTVH